MVIAMDSMQTGLPPRQLTPVAAVVRGLVAGAVGTATMDTVRYLRYRRGGGKDSPAEWEFPPVADWDEAPAPGQIAKRVLEGFTQRRIPPRWAWLTSTVAHWAYGSACGALYGIAAGSSAKARPVHGLPFGAAIWAGGYVVLPQAGLYQQIWKYDAKTLADDLTGHLAYGLGTSTFFWLTTKFR
ncbi:hypothetical protein [Actinacidiphila rubida]|uniref:hypothetical protein n=1 Tax=Actinacidiphila rubida TaxID=310780 RepID=UPI00114D2C43|nr:hypothetical protein [Actinacidiphila rubida]